MRITSKARSTIPQAIREQAACNPAVGASSAVRSGVLEKVEDEGPQQRQEAMGGFLCAAGCDSPAPLP